LFGVERLEQHAESLAAAERIATKPTRKRILLPRVRENRRVLVNAYHSIVAAVGEKREITLAEEWFLDNFHVVDEQIREIRDDLPAGYYRRLPKIAAGHLAGCPRVYGIAWAYVAHTDTRFEIETLRRFIRAYQRVQPLSIGEIWAVPVHLRMALVENLRRLSDQVIRARHARAKADELADRLLGLSGRLAEGTERVLRGLDEIPLADAFAVQLVQRLRDQDESITPALVWLDRKLGAQGTSPGKVVAREHHSQAAANATVRNIITSMRWMSSIDWLEFFESVSLVDQELRANETFQAMDFATRDEYRKQVEILSRGSGRPEIEVARRAVLLARQAAEERRRQHGPAANGGDSGTETQPVAGLVRAAEDPGFYLLSAGRRTFERALGFRVHLRLRLQRAFRAQAIVGYLGLIIVITAMQLFGLLSIAGAAGAGVGGKVLLALLGLVPASDIAVAVVDRLVAALIPPTKLPKLECALGVPVEFRTLVAVPTLLTRVAEIEAQLQRLEVHYLSNPEGHLHFALVTDWPDATCEQMAGDEELVAALADGIRQLNARHEGPPAGGDRFLLLHRRRLWNGSEGKWIGWERKRGKLHELNRLLRGAADTTFMGIDGRPPVVPENVRYVITLDADTRLPKGTAYRLVGAMAHPLNRPRFDPQCARVVEGYAVLQPRITPFLPTGPGSTAYQRIVSGPGGVDPYGAAVSDVYQDLFGEGSFAGKGIYDVDAFHAALKGKVPENSLLSHDLFEGVFARAGLLTDVDLFEEFPSNYEVGARRQHRWVRGDWQLLPWVVGCARDAAGRKSKVRIPGRSRWKMFDNLRRSLSPPSSFLLVAAAWTLPGVPSLLGFGLFAASITVPSMIPVLVSLVPRRWGSSRHIQLRTLGQDLFIAASQIFLSITMLAYRASLMADAIARTLSRLFFTKRHLLEWVPAAHLGYGADLKLPHFYRHLRWGVVLAALAALLLVLLKPAAWPMAAPFIALWAFSPAYAWRISVPPKPGEAQALTPQEIRALRLVARRTWRFFEQFVGAQGHALPPDNFQQDPEPVVAYRTSPTNIGVYLLSTTVAHDFGWIGLQDTAKRLEDTFTTIEGLRRFHGHLFNWYDLHDLRPLDPVYVSTVDSGNLAGHLIAIAQACREFMQQPRPGLQILEGIRDAVDLLIDAERRAGHTGRAQIVTSDHLREAILGMRQLLEDPPASDPEWSHRFDLLEAQADNLLDIARTLADAEQKSATEVLVWVQAVKDCVLSHARDLEAIRSREVADGSGLAEIDIGHRLSALALRAEDMVRAMDFRFLFDTSRKLFAIGYRVAEGAPDPGCYDLLASEARLGSFVAIAKGDVSPRHWFLLGRALTPVGRGAALVSWSGSMFEYLMPLLVMQQPERSILDNTCHLVVERQIEYGAERSVPWGVSESGYNLRDVELTYQYSNFGVPGLGLKRGLFEDVVVAPYATALAAMLEPRAALHNFARLEKSGAMGDFGFYEALDYTPSRLPEDARVAVVRSYMAHHQGMTIVALGNVVHDGLTQKRFHSYPTVQASELLLQERSPHSVALTRTRGEAGSMVTLVRDATLPALRRFESPHDITPRSHLLSNGRYTVMITAAGAGFSRWENLAVTRWREDTTRDCWGTFLYLRDIKSGEVWSAGFQPSATEMDHYQVVYAEDRAKIIQRDGSLSIALEVIVSTVDDAELRQLTVTNVGNRVREIDITSYAEVVLAPQSADEAHPAFSNLFVETEFIAELGTLLATRRPRSAGERQVWLAHVVAVEAQSAEPLQCESDRARFLGRGRGIRSPLSVVDGGPLSDTAGAVLDPVVSLRQRLAVPQDGTVRLVFTTLVAASRAEALELAEKYRQSTTFERESSLAWTQAQVQLHHLKISQDEAHLFQRIANRLLYADPTLRAAPKVLAANRSNASGLWRYGISGDLPIAMIRIERDEERDLVRQLLRAREYLNLKGIAADLVILNASGASYLQSFQESLEDMLRASQAAGGVQLKERGDVFLLRADLVPERDQVLLSAASRFVLHANRGTLAEQLVRLEGPRPGPVPLRQRTQPETDGAVPGPSLDLQFFNGLGGFTPCGREYVTVLNQGQWTPAPWINVVANPQFGFQVSESGSGYTWSVNSRENKLTPWANDPVSDTSGEAFYVRDEESGQLWGPTSLPIRDEPWPHVIRHGQGYSRFAHTSHGIALDLLQFVPPRDSVKISRLAVENRSDRGRRLTVTAYAEWVLGVSRSKSAPFVVTEMDPGTRIMFARNTWNGEFAQRIAFADMAGRQTSWTADRREFLGRNSSIGHPASLERGDKLSGKTGAGLDPCAVLQTSVELEPGERTELLFLLGEGADHDEARSLVEKYRALDCEAVLGEVQDHWNQILETVQVETPDAGMNLLLNRWLLYQTVSCRLWARSALYQSGGAFGFRDQLQDVLALAVARPGLVREHLLRAAARQFREGDVQHWWHPPTGRGIRSRISDDRLWLPYAVIDYLRTTKDDAVLDERVAWLDGPTLKQDEEEAYFQPEVSEDQATLYEHCARALDRSLELGSHGLPLMGTGDWNDGMNRVGQAGQGESVWLGWFMLTILGEFAQIADLRGEHKRAALWRQTVATLEASVEAHAWDGAWYRRAFFDDGTPLGSADNDECQIDSIAQSWAVISGAGDKRRARRAMESVEQRLVRRNDRLMLLLSPPFIRTPLDPGYIKGYLAGIRENGGQYTHAAVWSVVAFAMLGEGGKAVEFFNLLSPVHRASRRADIHRYKVEPYAVAADVYSESPHVGRGGWTWYSGAAGWLYRAGLEWILGFRKQGSALSIDPCVPREWKRFKIAYRFGGTPYTIVVENPDGVCRGVLRVTLDGDQLAAAALVPLFDDGTEHHVEVLLGSAREADSHPARPLSP
jgi:cyclic beta-1,2-glucan glucanotransferase